MRMLFRYWRKVYARAVLLSLKIILATCFVIAETFLCMPCVVDCILKMLVVQVRFKLL